MITLIKSERLRNHASRLWLYISFEFIDVKGGWMSFKTRRKNRGQMFPFSLCLVDWHQFSWPPPLWYWPISGCTAYESQQCPRTGKIPHWPCVHSRASVKWGSANCWYILCINYWFNYNNLIKFIMFLSNLIKGILISSSSNK